MSLFISVCMLIVSNVLLMSNATVMVRYGGSFWLKPVAVVLLIQCICRVFAFISVLFCNMRNVVCNVW